MIYLIIRAYLLLYFLKSRFKKMNYFLTIFKNKTINFLILMQLILFSQFALANNSLKNSDYTLSDALLTFMGNLAPIPKAITYFAFFLAFLLIFHTLIMLMKYGKDHQIRGIGILTRIWVSVMLVSIGAIISIVGNSIFGQNGNFYYKTVSETVDTVDRTAINNCINKSNCEKY